MPYEPLNIVFEPLNPRSLTCQRYIALGAFMGVNTQRQSSGIIYYRKEVNNGRSIGIEK